MVPLMERIAAKIVKALNVSGPVNIQLMARENDVTGRGRIALEGVNCTLTASPAGARRFCQGLRDWDPDLFNDTDFKLTDGVPAETKFKALTLKTPRSSSRTASRSTSPTRSTASTASS